MIQRFMHPCHLMVDLETLGTQIGSPIVTIGAVLFDPTHLNTADELMARSMMWRIDLKDAVTNSIGMDPDTLRWWFGQEDSAIKALVEGQALTLNDALKGYANYAKARDTWVVKQFPEAVWNMAPATCLWAKSPDFDAKMLEYAFTTSNLLNPFKFSEYRCVRTVQDMAWPNGPDDRPKFDVGTAHNAQIDAVMQALTIQAGFHTLGLSVKQSDTAVFSDPLKCGVKATKVLHKSNK